MPHLALGGFFSATATGQLMWVFLGHRDASPEGSQLTNQRALAGVETVPSAANDRLTSFLWVSAGGLNARGGAGEKPEAVRTHLRNMLIVPEMIGSVIGVYNGKTFNQVRPTATPSPPPPYRLWAMVAVILRDVRR